MTFKETKVVENNIEYTVGIYADGNKVWYLNGERHREDGPAIEWANGDKEWYLNDKLHREDGPAVELINDNKFWYVNGEVFKVKNNEEFLRLMKIKAFF